ncbi:YpzG family protein [Bacillus sp. HMF5848]|uniref:YpzG family protein n=1 Tax=Bacillus sp. HMF5848 TaxID=2495421 RepID=UPI000F797446|nr:YpzG family protein [Bacillus sp. HMF5848]RSK26146.1 YpzG family protein [Bacillus sp. HMF5848]
MNNKHKKFYDQLYSNPFNQPWASRKHANAQVNGETQQTQNLIILENQTRKRS